MINIRWKIFVFLVFMLFSGILPLQAQVNFSALKEKKTSEEPKEKKAEKISNRGPIYAQSNKQKYRFGMIFEARGGGACSDISGSVPVPMDFPDQQVRILEEHFPNRTRVFYRELKEGGVKQLVMKAGTLRSGQKLEASVLMEIDRKTVLPPEDTSVYRIPHKTPRNFRLYLREGLYMESGSKKIRDLARSLTREEGSDWKKVEALFNYVRKNIAYKEDMAEAPIRGALAALRSENGDCEDMCALFIALCRSQDIPARLVHVPGHCFAEFYLIDEKGKGYWFPAQVAGTEPFGGMQDPRIILQKGDSFRIPESREDVLYVKELFTGSVKEGSPDPKYQFIREKIE
ncbi:MAG: transglutaminase-like domain-containing protein [Planctomycetia bacterium]|nr:transglutaminase-like domain-containing protein [Planctomycetia bacterium]